MLKMASVGQRIGGGLIDLVVSFVLVLLFGWITGLAETSSPDAGASISIGGWPFLFACLVVFVMFAQMEASLGKTPGKYVARTRVTDEHGNRVALAPALIRNILRFIDGIAFYAVGLVFIMIDKQNRRLGDMLANTYVVADD
ncbi:MAG: RDD family protein [Alphaproteobacteria bacterium]|jgi:uncharacterized RDD family membrane protein YckC|nr:RDD family protein [Alphaproteobacteria bacterium]|tara:strand:- start:73 stop:498 length:426 start_codon:yes stop_codon:yes gene_type:complete